MKKFKLPILLLSFLYSSCLTPSKELSKEPEFFFLRPLEWIDHALQKQCQIGNVTGFCITENHYFLFHQ